MKPLRITRLIFLILIVSLAACTPAPTPVDQPPGHEKATSTSLDGTATSEAAVGPNPTQTSPAIPLATATGPSPTDTELPLPPTSEMDASVLAELGYVPEFEAAPCKFTRPGGFKPECGFLTVPEDRSNPTGRQVRLHVAIYRSRSPNPAPDPVIYLTGGGGGNELDRAIRYLDEGNDAILEKRDFIMYSQRGTRYNDPFLECHGYSEHVQELVFQHASEDELDSQVVEFLSNCSQEYQDMGIDLDMYNTSVNAADLNDLRVALGYEKVNIYGTSYGTRLALYVLRNYGEHIRSAIIDSVYPPQIHYYSTFATNAYQTFERIFEACAASEPCQQKYPDLENAFYRVVDELNANPRTMDYNGTEDAIQYDGDNFVTAMYLLPYTSQTEYLPLMTYQASQGDYSSIEGLIPYTFDIGGEDVIADAVHYSIQCREETPFDSYDQLVELGDRLPSQIFGAYDSPFEFNLCAVWGVEPAPGIDREPVVSDVPTLILAGEFDPITPPEWSMLAGETLSNSYYYVFPGHGHGVMRSVPCGFQIGHQFLNDPLNEPDASCIDEMPGIVFE